MKILFLFPREQSYDSVSVRENPCGGTEKTVIFLGEAFKKLGYQVEWATTLSEVKAACETSPDIVITQEAYYFEAFPEAKKVWWCHHFPDQPVIQRNSAYGRCFADKVVTLSRCQADEFKSKLKINSVIIGHGVWHNELAPPVAKNPYRLIYSSTPFRGLEKIPKLFKEIKEREPRASIAICSSMETYGIKDEDKQYQEIFDELEQMEGVDLLGSLNQKELYKQYARATIFFYPCTWRETYCLALDEAIAHGCYAVVPDIGALTERLFSHDDTLPCCNFTQSEGMKSYTGKYYTWESIAKTWERYVLK